MPAGHPNLGSGIWLRSTNNFDVGIGSDFDGVSGNLPEDLKTVADYPNLIAGLQARGFSDDSIRKILGENTLRVWRAIEAGAER